MEKSKLNLKSNQIDNEYSILPIALSNSYNCQNYKNKPSKEKCDSVFLDNSKKSREHKENLVEHKESFLKRNYNAVTISLLSCNTGLLFIFTLMIVAFTIIILVTRNV